ncbi:MAG: type IV pilin [Halorientalis sp.]
MTRGQSNVVGVALLLGIAVISMAALTAAIGALVQHNAASADAARVATAFDDALEPVETTGQHRGTVRFTRGHLSTVDREIRVLDGSGIRATVEVGGLVFEAGERSVTYVGDAIVRRSGGSAWLHDGPPITAAPGGDVFVASVARLDASAVGVGGTGETSITVRTRVTHDRTALGSGTFGVAIETATPGPLERWFSERNASVARRDFDGDGTPSVVGRFPGNRTGYLVVHDMHAEVTGG